MKNKNLEVGYKTLDENYKLRIVNSDYEKIIKNDIVYIVRKMYKSILDEEPFAYRLYQVSDYVICKFGDYCVFEKNRYESSNKFFLIKNIEFINMVCKLKKKR